jgi:hypothetical protein
MNHEKSHSYKDGRSDIMNQDGVMTVYNLLLDHRK